MRAYIRVARFHPPLRSIRLLPNRVGTAGRPKGALNKTTLAARALLDREAEQITRKCVELAKAGDTTALRLCLERLLPPRREESSTCPR